MRQNRVKLRIDQLPFHLIRCRSYSLSIACVYVGNVSTDMCMRLCIAIANEFVVIFVYNLKLLVFIVHFWLENLHFVCHKIYENIDCCCGCELMRTMNSIRKLCETVQVNDGIVFSCASLHLYLFLLSCLRSCAHTVFLLVKINGFRCLSGERDMKMKN